MNLELILIGPIVFVVCIPVTYVFQTMLLTGEMRRMWSRDGRREVPGWWVSWFRYATCRRIDDGRYIRKDGSSA